MNLIDIGANLTHEQFSGDLDAVLERAQDVGVSSIVVTGACEQSNEAALNLANQHDWLFATAGVHPHHAKDYSAVTTQRINELVAKEKVKAVGETGLDFYRNFSSREQQISAFESQLEIAIDTKMPLFMHERDAHDDFYQIIKTHRDQLDQAVVHCFTGDKKALFNYLDLNLHIGITGWICDKRRGHHLKELVVNIPSNRLMIETDSPYLLPRDLKKKAKHYRNEPSFLPHILATVAQSRNESIEELATATTKTAKEFFAI